MGIEALNSLFNNFSDVIPTEVKHGNLSYKVQRNWWQGVVAELDDSLMKGEISQDLIPDVENFLTQYTSPEFHQQQFTTAEDLQKANDIIQRVVGL